MHDNSDDSFNEIRRQLITAAIDSDPHHAENIERTLDDVMQGARVEAVARTLFEQAGIPHRAATTDEDLRGADIIMTFDGKEYPIDLKKSLDQVSAVASGYEFTEQGKTYAVKSYKGNKSILLWPCFVSAKLGDKLTLDEKYAPEVCQRLRVQMAMAMREF